MQDAFIIGYSGAIVTQILGEGEGATTERARRAGRVTSAGCQCQKYEKFVLLHETG